MTAQRSGHARLKLKPLNRGLGLYTIDNRGALLSRITDGTSKPSDPSLFHLTPEITNHATTNLLTYRIVHFFEVRKFRGC